MAAPFFYHERMTRYDFGPQHPLKPERLRRTIELYRAANPDANIIDPGVASFEDIERVHDPAYIDVIRRVSAGEPFEPGEGGLGNLDNPPFAGMYEASLAYCAGSLAAARAVCEGAPLAFGIAGGLHHAMRDHAAGFCIFNDCALAISVLRHQFERVLYVDIDVHHGDGVQEIFRDDPNVMTFSIHENPATLWPGTGDWNETDATFTAMNMPVPKGTTGPVWHTAFSKTLRHIVNQWKPHALVLQMGTDTHINDPLAHLQVQTQAWLGAVSNAKDLGLPTVALGGGGYNLANVPRMWVGACLLLQGVPLNDDAFMMLPDDWGMDSYFDAGAQPETNLEQVEATIRLWREHVGAHIPAY